jgi:hypothetical protein
MSSSPTPEVNVLQSPAETRAQVAQTQPIRVGSAGPRHETSPSKSRARQMTTARSVPKL